MNTTGTRVAAAACFFGRIRQYRRPSAEQRRQPMTASLHAGESAGMPARDAGQYTEGAMTRWRTFAEMRSQGTRQHVMFHELLAAAAERGVSWRRNRLLKEIAHVGRPTVKRYGHLHYGREHLEAVVAAAELAKAGRAKS